MAKKKVYSVKKELLVKSKEACLSSIQIFNNPNITFKSETYIVLMIIGWTYLLHAYYRSINIDYRYYKISKKGQRKIYDKTSKGAYKYWELERCLNDKACPIDKDTKNNLYFLIGLRHEIEHQMTSRIDDLLSARFQSCVLNFNDYIKKLFGEEYSVDKHLSFCLQLSTISEEQKELLTDYHDLPDNIRSYIIDYDEDLSDDEFNSSRFSYRVIFTPKLANHKGQADKVIEFIKPDSELAKGISKEYYVLKESEKKKYLPKQIVEMMQQEYPNFNMHSFVNLWKNMDAKNPKYNYGVLVSNKNWYWYENWVEEVKKYCKNNMV